MTEPEKKQVINDELKARLKDENIWVHLVQLIMYGIAFMLTSWILLAVTILHFVLRLLTGEPNKELQRFGQSLSTYLYEIVQFASFNTNDKPFPLSSWPSGPPTTVAVVEDSVSEEE